MQSAAVGIRLLLESMARYQVILAYDGTEYKGFQRLAQKPTVQSAVEDALHRIGWDGKSILVAGRTDSGVHAIGQVIAFDFLWKHTPQELQAALNVNLPRSIVAHSVALVDDDFHPRYRASGRRYRYRIYCQPERDPFQERFAWRLWPAPDIDLLHPLAQRLLGTHDFKAFGTSPKAGGHTVRTVSQASWVLTVSSPGVQELVFEIVANAFLYRMVRRLVFIQVAIARRRLEQDLLDRLLESPPPGPCQGLAPSCGLALVEVFYPSSV